MSARSYFQVSLALSRDVRVVRAIRLTGDAAVSLWLFALAWSRSELTDGVIPADMLALIHPLCSKPVDKVAAALVSVGLWRLRADGDYEIAGYTSWNPSKEAVEEKLAEDRRRKKKGGAVSGNPTADEASHPESSERIPSGFQPESNGSEPGFRDGSKRREERVKRKEERKEEEVLRTSPQPQPGDPLACVLLAKLEALPALRAIATARHAETLAGRVHAKGSKPDWVAAALDDLARDAQASADSGTLWTSEHMAKMASKYVDNARAPKAGPVTPGDVLTPEQLAAAQRRNGVQVGTSGPSNNLIADLIGGTPNG